MGGGLIGGIFMGVASAVLGSLFSPEQPDIHQSSEGPRLNDLRVQTSTYGRPIPLHYGRNRLSGNVIWALDIEEEVITTTQTTESGGGGKGGGGKGGGQTVTQTHTEYKYYGTFAVALCAGPVSGVGKIWLDGKLYWDGNKASQEASIFNNLAFSSTVMQGKGAGVTELYAFNENDFRIDTPGLEAPWGLDAVPLNGIPVAFYAGTESQTADPIIAADKGNLTPGYRGLCYLVFNRLPLEGHGNRIPVVSAEVYGLAVATAIDGNVIVDTDPVSSGSEQDLDSIHVADNDGVFISAIADGVIRRVNWRNSYTELFSMNGNYIDRVPISTKYDVPFKIDSFNNPNDIVGFMGKWTLFSNDRNRYEYPIDPAGAFFPQLYAVETVDWFVLTAGDIDDARSRSPYGNIWELIIPAGSTRYAGSICISSDGQRLLLWTRDSLTSPTTVYWHRIALFDSGIVVEEEGSIAASTLNTSDYQISTISSAGRDIFQNGVHSMWPDGADEFIYHSLEPNHRYLWIGRSSGFGIHGVACFKLDSSASPSVVRVANFEGLSGAQDSPTPIYAFEGGAVSFNDTHYRLFSRAGGYEYSSTGDTDLPTVVGELCEKTGLTSSQYDTSGISASIIGYTASRIASARQLLNELRRVYQFDGLERNGVLYFKDRTGSSVATIEEDDLAAHPEGSDLPPLRKITRLQELELPRKIFVKYASPGRSYQIGTQYASRLTTSAVDIETIELPLVLTDNQARQAADRILFSMWQERNQYEFFIPPSYLKLEPIDTVTLSLTNATHTVRLTKLELSDFGLLRCEGVEADASVYSSDASGADSSSTLVGIASRFPGPTELVLIDGPPLTDEANTPKVYAAMGKVFDAWRGGALLQSSDGNAYTNVASTTVSCPMGSAKTALGSTTRYWIMDKANTVDVRLLNGTLSSVTKDDLLNGNNVAMLGDELIQFQTATLNANGTYTLSNLIRGRRGTEHAIDSHAADEDFVLLDQGGWIPHTIPSDEIGNLKWFKAVTLNRPATGVAADKITFNGNNLKPFSVVHVEGTRDGSNDLTISWISRTRVAGEWRDYVDAPLGEESESYEIDVIVGGSVARTLTSSSTSVSYTAAQQTTDGITPGDPVTVKVYQMSSVIGRGYVKEATV